MGGNMGADGAKHATESKRVCSPTFDYIRYRSFRSVRTDLGVFCENLNNMWL